MFQFNVIHRFVADWNNLEDWTRSRNQDIAQAFNTYRQFFPRQEDVKGSVIYYEIQRNCHQPLIPYQCL